MFVIVDSKAVFYALLVGMFMIYLHNKFNMLKSDCYLVNPLTLKDEDKFLIIAILNYFTGLITLTNVFYIMKSYCYDPGVNNDIVTPSTLSLKNISRSTCCYGV
jgi:hypothetical protein